MRNQNKFPPKIKGFLGNVLPKFSRDFIKDLPLKQVCINPIEYSEETDILSFSMVIRFNCFIDEVFDKIKGLCDNKLVCATVHFEMPIYNPQDVKFGLVTKRTVKLDQLRDKFNEYVYRVMNTPKAWWGEFQEFLSQGNFDIVACEQNPQLDFKTNFKKILNDIVDNIVNAQQLTKGADVVMLLDKIQKNRVELLRLQDENVKMFEKLKIITERRCDLLKDF